MMTALVMLLSFLVSAAVLRQLFCLAPQLGLLDHPGERRKVHRHAIPPIGGIAIFAGILAGTALTDPMTAAHCYALGGAALLVLVGAWDDRFGLGPKTRLLAQIGATLLLTLGGGVTLTSLGDPLGLGPIELGDFALPFTIFAMVGIINAVNMLDGIDGLAGGLTLITLGTLLLIAPEIGPVQVLMLTTLAALIPYLVCNLELFGFTRHKVFLGDAGSLLLGYLLVWALIDSANHTGGILPVTALWLVAIPLMDTLAVMGRRLSQGRHPFSADRGHLHHLLARTFHSPRKALVLILLLTGLLAGIGVAGLAQQVAEPTMFYAALTIFVLYLAFLRHAQRLYRQVKHRRRQRAAEGPE